MRDQLLEQIVGELRKLVLELELHARREERGTFQQPAHHRIGPVLQDAAEPLRNAGIFFGELARLFVKQLQFPIVKIEKFAVHARLQSINDNFSALNNVSNEFYGNLNGIARQIRTDQKPHLEFVRIHAHVAFDFQRGRGEAGLEVDQSCPDFFGNSFDLRRLLW